MTEPDVTRPDHREHGKMPARPDDDALAALTDRERDAVATDEDGSADDESA